MTAPTLGVPAARYPLAAAAPVDRADPAWRWLYWLAGAAALLTAAIIVAQSAVFAVAPPPESVAGWFALFQANGLLGLLAFELLMIVYVVLSIPVALALAAALWRTSPSWTALYLALSLVGFAAWITARPAFEMLALSQGYAAATTDAQRAALLAAGEAMVARFDGTAFQVSYILGSITGLIVSAVMLRSTIFSKATAYVRIASSVLDAGLFVPVVGLYFSLLSVVCLLLWNILIARRLFRLARAAGPDNA